MSEDITQVQADRREEWSTITEIIQAWKKAGHNAKKALVGKQMPLHFKSKEAYRKWSAYKHIHLRKKKKHREKIYIAGKLHHVEHRR